MKSNALRGVGHVKPNRSQRELSSESTSTSFFRRSLGNTATDYTAEVLHMDQHYCVINKPYDVRMDGNFDVTVAKIVSKSLNLPEASLKWVHQLDFATSGVLCIGLTKEGAAAASSAFAHRITEKQYLAVLQGHVSLDQWPVYSEPFEKSEFVDFSHRSRNKRKIKDLKKQAQRHSNRPDRSSSPQAHHKARVETSTDPAKMSVEEARIALGTFWQEELMHHNLEICYQYLHKLAGRDPPPSHLRPTKYSLPEVTVTEEQRQRFQQLVYCTSAEDNSLTETTTDDVTLSTGERHRRRQQQERASGREYQHLLTLPFEQLAIAAKKRKLLRKLLQECDVTPPLLESSVEAYQKLTGQGKEEEVEESRERKSEVVSEGEEEEGSGEGMAENDELSALEQENFFAPDIYLEERCRYYRENNLPPPPSTSSIATATPLTPPSPLISRSYPFIYRYQPPPSSTPSSDDPYSDRERLLIRIPLTEIDDEFRVEPSHPDEKREEMQDSATELIILDNNAYYQGQAVTKVLLRPLTGRRHQLRLHSLCIGHAIVGDFTYNHHYRHLLHHTFHRALAEAATQGLTNEQRFPYVNDVMASVVCDRMMLHAYSLKIPLADGGAMKCSKRFRKQVVEKMQDSEPAMTSTDDGEENNKQQRYLIDVTSPDPFPIIDTVLKPL
eukprot:gene7345-7926_t